MPSRRTEPKSPSVRVITEDREAAESTVDLFAGFECDPDEYTDPFLLQPEEIMHLLWCAGYGLEEIRAAAGDLPVRKRGRPPLAGKDSSTLIYAVLNKRGSPLGIGERRRDTINRRAPLLLRLIREIGIDRARSMLVEVAEIGLSSAASGEALAPFVPRSLRKKRICQVVLDVTLP